MVQNRFLRLIECLVRHEVRFVVVGGVAAVLQRVPINTQDFDIVHERSAANVERLLLALAELKAVFRDDPRQLRPNASHLQGPGHCLLESGSLKFDVLGAIEPGGNYAELMAASERMIVGGFEVSVLTLPKLIEIKRGLPRPKDQLMLLHLLAALEEREKGQTGRQ
jgi:hypothetical protein